MAKWNICDLLSTWNSQLNQLETWTNISDVLGLHLFVFFQPVHQRGTKKQGAVEGDDRVGTQWLIKSYTVLAPDLSQAT